MAVRDGHQFSAARLEQWLERHIAGFVGPLHVEQFKGGQSNPTYKLITPARSYVLTRKPLGKLLPGAHAVDRRSEEHTSELQSLMRTSYAVFCLNKKNKSHN